MPGIVPKQILTALSHSLGGRTNDIKGVTMTSKLSKLAQGASAQSENNFWSIFSSTQDIVVRIDRCFRFIFANPALL
mgnify:CR=1 FL=1